MIASEGENQPPLFGVRIDLIGDATGDCGHRARVLHVAVGRVIGGDEVAVEVDGVVAVQAIPEFVAELGEQAGFEER